VQPIIDSECLLLRSPVAVEGAGGAVSAEVKTAKGHFVMLRDQVKDLVENTLLPTPSVAHIRNHDEPIENYLGRRQDYLDGKTKGMPGVSLGVAVRIEALLPTPVTTDYKQTNSPAGWNRHSPPLGTIVHGSWGKFEPAIRRWEKVFGREAPAPTNPDGKNGSHRLAAEFVEWMMGLPEGWVTDPELGLKRNDQLKALGNGVVPQQAKYALQLLLDDELLERLGKK